jgi:hypothetical protein
MAHYRRKSLQIHTLRRPGGGFALRAVILYLPPSPNFSTFHDFGHSGPAYTVDVGLCTRRWFVVALVAVLLVGCVSVGDRGLPVLGESLWSGGHEVAGFVGPVWRVVCRDRGMLRLVVGAGLRLR